MTHAVGHPNSDSHESIEGIFGQVIGIPHELIRKIRAAMAQLTDSGKNLEGYIDTAKGCWCFEHGDIFLQLLSEYQEEMQTTTARLGQAYIHGSLSLADITDETFRKLGISRDEVMQLLYAGSLRWARIRIEEAQQLEPPIQGDSGGIPGLKRGFQGDEERLFLGDIQHIAQGHREITLDFIPEPILYKLWTTLPELRQLRVLGIIHTSIAPLIRSARQTGSPSSHEQNRILRDFLQEFPDFDHIDAALLALAGMNRAAMQSRPQEL